MDLSIERNRRIVTGTGESEDMSSGRRPLGVRPGAGRKACRREEHADRVIHALGVIASVGGLIGLVVAARVDGGPGHAGSVLIYGAALVATLSTSAAYNVLRHTSLGPRLRRADHAMIFVMIAATYTPFLVVKIAGAWGFGLLAVVWAVAGIGAAIKVVYPRRFERSAIVLYLALGWIIVVAWKPFVASVSAPAVMLLAVGGLLYSAGVLFYLWTRLPCQRAVWHAFVLAAAACHYAAVMGEVAMPGLWS